MALSQSNWEEITAAFKAFERANTQVCNSELIIDKAILPARYHLRCGWEDLAVINRNMSAAKMISYRDAAIKQFEIAEAKALLVLLGSTLKDLQFHLSSLRHVSFGDPLLSYEQLLIQAHRDGRLLISSIRSTLEEAPQQAKDRLRQAYVNAESLRLTIDELYSDTKPHGASVLAAVESLDSKVQAGSKSSRQWSIVSIIIGLGATFISGSILQPTAILSPAEIVGTQVDNKDAASNDEVDTNDDDEMISTE